MTRANWYLGLACIVVLLAKGASGGTPTSYTVGASTGGWDFTTVALALAGSDAGDTIIVQADTVHTVPLVTLHHEMTLKGATDDHSLYIIEPTADGSIVVDSTSVIRDIYFRTDDDLTTIHALIRGLTETSELRVLNCEFNGCVATNGTAAIKVVGRVVVDGCRFEDCTGTSANKAGVISTNPGSGIDCIIRGSQFINCEGNNYGIIYYALGAADADTVLIEDCSFSLNTTTVDGAVIGLAIIATKFLDIQRCTFHENTCTAGADGIFGAWLDMGDGGIDLTQVNVVGASSTRLATIGVLRNVSKLNVYGTDQDYVSFYISGTAADTFHVDPAYLSKSVSPDKWDYRVSQSDLVTHEIGHVDPTATRWYTDPTARELYADGTSTYPFTSICAAQGLSNQDTLTVGTGYYAETATCTLGAAIGRYGLTMAGAGYKPQECRIVSSADIAFYTLAGSSTVRNLKFTAVDSVALDTSSRGFVTLLGNTYNDTLTLRNVVVESLTRSGGYTDNDGFAVVSHGLGTSTLASLFINEISDVLYTGTNAHTGSALVVQPSGSGFSLVDSCVIANVRSGMPVHFVGVEDKLSWRHTLMVDCDAVGADVEEAVMRLCGNCVAGSPEFRFTYSTWVDCNNVVGSLGIVGLHDLDLCTIDHCVFYGSTKCIDNYGTAEDDLDSLAYCDSYGAPFIQAVDLSGTPVDTFHVHPNFNQACTAAPCYTARAAECRDTNDASYMGWLHYIPGVMDMSAGHRRTLGRRR